MRNARRQLDDGLHEMMLPKSVRTFPENIAVFSSAVKSGEALTAASEPACGARGA